MSIVSQSGTYKAPVIQDLEPNCPLYGKNIYFIKPYQPGFSIFALLGNDVDVTLQLLTWDGVIITELDELHMKALSLNEAFIPVASASGINRYQIFFSSDLIVTDFVEPQGQFVSPGMLAQLFEQSFSVQQIVAKGVLDANSVNNMLNEHQELILKPSVKTVVGNNKTRPLYARIYQSMATHS